MIASSMLTLLVDQYRRLGAGFAEKYAHPWLVWEAKDWRAPSLTGSTVSGTTRSPLSAAVTEQALCFALPARPAKDTLTVGRASTCDIVINDGTVSRTHATLFKDPKGLWHVRREPGSAEVRYGQQEVLPGADVVLTDWQTLQLGSAQVTFLRAESMVQRVKALASSTTTPSGGSGR